MLRNMNLSTKLIAVLLLVSLIPLIGISAFSFYRSDLALREEAYSELDIFAHQTAAIFHEYFSSRVDSTTILSKTRDIYQSLNTLYAANGRLDSQAWLERVAILDELLPTFMSQNHLSMVSVLNDKGITVYSTNRSTLGVDLSARVYFKSGMQGTRSVSEVFYSDVVKEHVMAIAEPIFSDGSNSTVSGVLLSIIPQKALAAVLNDGLDALGNSADAYLVDENGIILTEPRLTEATILETRISTSIVQELSTALKAGQITFNNHAEYQDTRGVLALGDVRIVDMGGVKAGLVVKIDRAEALGAALSMRNIMLIVASVSAIAIVLVGWSVARSITKPILAAVSGLGEGVQQIAAASQQLAAASQQLASANGQQAAAVQETSATLEQTSSMVMQNTENTRQAALLSNQAKGTAEKGNAEMQDMMGSMIELKKSSDQIAKIIKVIDEIAFQALGDIAVQAKKVNELVEEVAAASQEQSQGIGQINKAVSQVEQATQQNAASAEESASASEELSAQASTMKDIVHRLTSLVNGSSVTLAINTEKATIQPKRAVVPVKAQTNRGKAKVKPEEVIPLDDDLQGF